MRTATMDEVLRQRDPALLASVMHARHGEAGAAIRGLGAERVREVDREELGAEAARCWLALSPEDRAETAIMAPTHEIRRQTNEAVREGLAGEGVLHGRALVVDRLVNRRLTRTLAADLRSYEPGDIVVFHRDVFGCRANDVCTVMGGDEGQVLLAHADGGERRFRPSGKADALRGIPGRELAAHLGAVGASQDAVDKAEEGIAERIARDEAARAAAAEAERQAREQARLAAEQARAAQKEADERRERDRQRVAAFLVRADDLPRKFLRSRVGGIADDGQGRTAVGTGRLAGRPAGSPGRSEGAQGGHSGTGAGRP